MIKIQRRISLMIKGPIRVPPTFNPESPLINRKYSAHGATLVKISTKSAAFLSIRFCKITGQWLKCITIDMSFLSKLLHLGIYIQKCHQRKVKNIGYISVYLQLITISAL